MDRALVVVLMTLVAGGCGEGTPDSSRLASSRQLGDTTFVFSTSALRGTGSLREVSRIGMIDGPPEYLLSRWPVFTVGPDGSLFVADAASDLRYYDADGTYVRTIARQGQGPGEVRYVVGMDISVEGLPGHPGLRQSTRQCLFARRHPHPRDQTESVGGKTRKRTGCRPMGR